MQNVKPKLSSMMTELYGEDAQKIYDRLQELDPFFNKFVQEVVYDDLFRLPPLNLRDKSLVTVVSLLTLNKAEQTRVHLLGFLNLGFKPQTVVAIINYMFKQKYIQFTENALTILQNIVKEKNLKCDFAVTAYNDLSRRDIALIVSAVRIALGDNHKTQECFKNILKEQTLTAEEIKGILRHLMIYCGCPSAMNGFAVLREISI